ncbi:MAG: VWA domain-containing protein [Candidatus Sericytochromatia bacterium]|nr:VWA domain-containing protein [Candidatus Sericytochromatia bacterium]
MSWHLAAPAWLLAWLGLPLVAMLHWQGLQREVAAAEAYATREAWSRMGLAPGVARRAARGFLVLAALACLVLALAQPRLGPPGALGGSGGQGHVVIVLDVSKSMRVEDASGLGRLQAGLGRLDELLTRAPGWRFGVVTFAGDAEVVCPLTTDAEAVRTLLERARPGAGPGKGSNLEAGVRAALTLVPKAGLRRLLVVSDGEMLSGDAVGPVATARRQGIFTCALGVGTPEGGPVPGDADMWGNPTFLTWRGEQVRSQANFEALRGVVAGGGGSLVDAAEADAADRLAAALGVGAEARGDAASPRSWEPFQWPMLAALLLLLADAFLALRWRPRPQRHFSDALRAAIGRAGASAAWLLVVGALSGAGLYPAWLTNEAAARALAQGDRASSEVLLRDALSRHPNEPRLTYNLGCVLYARGAYDEAEQAFVASLTRCSPADRPWVRYNLGNVRVRQAEQTGDRASYERAAEDYRAVLAVRPNDADASHNLAEVQRRLAQKPPASASRPRSGAGRGTATSQRKVGVQTHYSPPPLRQLPSLEEVNAALAALERAERQRLRDLPPASTPEPEAGLPDPAKLFGQVLRGVELEKDW